MSEKKKLRIEIYEDTHKKLKTVAAAHKLSVTFIVNSLIEAFLEKDSNGK